MLAAAYYTLFFAVLLIPTAIYCHYKDKESENNNEH